MGWASGSSLAGELWGAVRPLIAKDKRKKAAGKIIDLFEDYDCDTMYEVEPLIKDAGRESEYYGDGDFEE